MTRRPLDAAALDLEARESASTLFDRPLVIEAGAGTGKTTLLVARILSWSLADGWETARRELDDETGGDDSVAGAEHEPIAARVLEGVVAITFTEAAAAEMATRVAEGLAGFAAGREGDLPGLDALTRANAVAPAERRRRARSLIASFDRLTVQTIHAWCRSLLADYPLQAGLAPDLTVDADGRQLEETARRVVDERVREAYALSPDHPLSRLAARGLGPGRVAEATRMLVEKGLSAAGLAEDPLATAGATRQRLARRLDAFRDAAGEALGQVKRGRLAQQVDTAVAASRAALEEASGDQGPGFAGLLERLAEIWNTRSLARLAEWAREGFTISEREALGSSAAALADAARKLSRLLVHLGRLDLPLLELARRGLAPLVSEVEDELRARGIATFHSLLAEAERLLRTRPEVLARERRRRRQLLVDEFQDTDRLQCSLVRMLALEAPSEQAPVLFVVGDPKQSIYGWRNADLEAYGELVKRVKAAGGRVLPLVRNFRSVPAILDEVRRVVEPVMTPREGIQPPFEPLLPSAELAGEPGFARGRWAPVEHWVSWLPPTADGPPSGPATLAADAAALEAREVAADIRSLHDEQGVAWGSVGILMRATSRLSTFVEALRDAGVPFAVSRDRDYYRRREVIDAAALVRTVVDPLDHLALLTFLRSSAVGVPDAALLPLWCRDFPRLVTELAEPGSTTLGELRNLVTEAAAATPADSPGIEAVAGWPASLCAALETLVRLRRSFTSDPADRFLELLRLRTALEITESARYPRHYRRANLDRFFRRLDEALEERAGDAAAILRALRRAVAEAEEAEEAAPQEETGKVVRVMTVHGAKGLQFDHVYLVQLHARGRGRVRPSTDVDERWRPGEPPQHVLFGAPTLDFDRVEAHRLRIAAAERVRTLYVAMTRAAQRLVMVGCWPETPAPVAPESATSHLELLCSRRALPPSLDRVLTACREAGTDWCDEGAVRWRFLGLSGSRAPAAPIEESSLVVPPGVAEATARRLAERRREARERMATPFQGAASAESRIRLERLLDERDGAAPAGARDVALAVGDALHRLLETWDLKASVDSEWERQLRLLEHRLVAIVPPDLVPTAARRADRLLARIRRGTLFSRFLELDREVLAREVPVVLPPDDQRPVGFVSGVIDMVYRDAQTGEPVIVDYKTDEIEEETEIAARAAAYEPQERIYARALQQALELPHPPATELWFLWPDRMWKNAARH